MEADELNVAELELASELVHACRMQFTEERHVSRSLFDVEVGRENLSGPAERSAEVAAPRPTQPAGELSTFNFQAWTSNPCSESRLFNFSMIINQLRGRQHQGLQTVAIPPIPTVHDGGVFLCCLRLQRYEGSLDLPGVLSEAASKPEVTDEPSRCCSTTATA